jgi:hypothetical protein
MGVWQAIKRRLARRGIAAKKRPVPAEQRRRPPAPEPQERLDAW